MRAIPKLLGVEAVWLLWALGRDGLSAQRVRLLLLLLALSAAVGILYFPDMIHVAFVVPFALIVIAGMVHRLRTAFVFSERPAARALVRLGWVAVLAVVLAKGWTNARLAWMDNPVLYETAYGTLAGRDQAGTTRPRRMPHVILRPPRLFAHSTDVRITWRAVADNPTPFALLRPSATRRPGSRPRSTSSRRSRGNGPAEHRQREARGRWWRID